MKITFIIFLCKISVWMHVMVLVLAVLPEYCSDAYINFIDLASVAWDQERSRLTVLLGQRLKKE